MIPQRPITPPPGTKPVFVPAAVVLWPNMHVVANGKEIVFPMNERMKFANSRSFFPVYDTLADLRKDFPTADWTQCLVIIPPGTSPETAHLDIK